MSSRHLAVSSIQQDGSYEALIASSVPHGMARDADDIVKAFKTGVLLMDPRNESIIGSVMFRKVDPSRRGILLGDSYSEWTEVHAHFRRLMVWIKPKVEAEEEPEDKGECWFLTLSSKFKPSC